MSMSAFARGSFAAAVVATAAVLAAYAAEPAGTPQNRSLPPINSGANPYKVIRD